MYIILQIFSLLVKIVACEDRLLSRSQPPYALSVWSKRIERVGRSKLIQTNLTEPQDVELFIA